MTRKPLDNPKVRWQLGEGGALVRGAQRTELLERDYVTTSATLETLSFNVGLLDLQVSTVSAMIRPQYDEAK